MTGEGGRKRVPRGQILLTVVAAVLAVAALYCALVWFQSGRFLAQSSDIEQELSDAIREVNAATAGFQGDAGSAELLLDGLTDGRSEISGNIDDVSALRPPLPPGTAPARRYQAALLEYVSEVRAHHDRLESIATAIVERSDAIAELSEGLGVLEELSRPGVSLAEVEQVLLEAADTVEAAAVAVESVAGTETTAYSSAALLTRLNGLSEALREMQAAIGDQDGERLSEAADGFSRLLTAEWGLLFFEASRAGVDDVVSGIDALVAQRTEIDAARASLSRVRDTMAFGAAALAIVAGLAMATARLR